MNKIFLVWAALIIFSGSVQAKEHHSEEGVTPAQALKFLQNGNARFLSGKLRKDGQRKTDIARLVKGQKPHSIVLSCSDSRVPPEVVFDQKLGELFVVRTAGETLDPTSIASIEYAVEHLGSRLILVMGHSHCGAVKAALSTFGGKDAGSPNLNKLVADIHPRIQAYSRAPASDDVLKPAWANAKGVASDLLLRSEILKKKAAAGEIELKSALYDLRTGTVEIE